MVHTLVTSTGQQVGTYRITDEASFIPPISDWHSWMASSDPDYSFVSGNYYVYTGQPPGKAYTQYRLRFHFNFVGQNGDINTPGDWISTYETERQQNQFPHTTYAHLFTEFGKPVIQYWFFYPYNDGYNNHEGDWEHINVRLDGQNPASAAIEKIDFYAHGKVRILASGYQLVNGTHPIVYVGGNCAGHSTGCNPGNTTGGSFPASGIWLDIGAAGYDERVNGFGPTIGDNDLTIVILPDPDKIDYNSNPAMSWFNASIRWGNLESGSPWDWTEPLIYPLPDGWVEPDVGNNAPPGPAFNKGWSKVGSAGGSFNSY